MSTSSTPTSTTPSKMADLTGCQSLRDLWEVAKVCEIGAPGITGTPSRMYNFVQCGNVRHFMTLSMMKCWEERGSQEPPLVITEKVYSSSSDNTYRSNSAQGARIGAMEATKEVLKKK